MLNFPFVSYDFSASVHSLFIHLCVNKSFLTHNYPSVFKKWKALSHPWLTFLCDLDKQIRVFCRRSGARPDSHSYSFIQLLFRYQQSLNEWPVTFVFESLVYLHPQVSPPGECCLLALFRNASSQCLLTRIDQDPERRSNGRSPACRRGAQRLPVEEGAYDYHSQSKAPAHTCWWPPGWHFVK